MRTHEELNKLSGTQLSLFFYWRFSFCEPGSFLWQLLSCTLVLISHTSTWSLSSPFLVSPSKVKSVGCTGMTFLRASHMGWCPNRLPLAVHLMYATSSISFFTVSMVSFVVSIMVTFVPFIFIHNRILTDCQGSVE